MIEVKNKENNKSDFIREKDNNLNSNKSDTKKNRKIISVENLLCLFIILCPLFDILSFITRNVWQSKISVSTFIRPIIPVLVGIYIFIKADKKHKKFFLILAFTYILYAIIHLYIMKSLITGCSYGNVINELQYVFNYTFLIIYFIIYVYTFVKKSENKSNINDNLKKLRNSIVIMNFIYIVSIYFSIIIGKSSPTYTETGLGYKGFIESGNSLSAILILSMFIVLYVIKDNSKATREFLISIKKDKFNNDAKSKEIDNKNINEKKTNSTQINFKENITMFFLALITYILTSVYLIKLIGTRTGLIGTVLVLFVFTLADILINKNKKIAIVGISIICIIAVLVVSFGSNTIKRRR